MEKILLNQNKHWKKKGYKNVFYRKILDKLIDYLPMKEILILTGIRRSGKSSLFKLLINHLLKKNEATKILFINCEDPHFIETWSDSSKIYDIIEVAEKITENKFDYLFIDEIQNIKHWEKFVKSIYETGEYKKIFITGSNSNLLEDEYIKLLSGRFISKQIFPLSFLEILELNKITKYIDIVSEKSKVLNLLDDYLQFGGFPEVFKTSKNELKLEILSNYYQTIVLKDCILNKKIREADKFKQLAFYVFNNTTSVYTYNSLSRATESNENTTQSFIRALQESFVSYEINNFRFSVKINSRAKNKIYSTDNGLIQAVKFNFSSNKGKMLENALYMEIVKSGKFQVFFFNDKNECDFIIRSDKELYAIQVVYELNSANIEREVAGLRKVQKQFNIDNLMLITYNEILKIENIKTLTFVDFCYFLDKF